MKAGETVFERVLVPKAVFQTLGVAEPLFARRSEVGLLFSAGADLSTDDTHSYKISFPPVRACGLRPIQCIQFRHLLASKPYLKLSFYPASKCMGYAG